MANETFIHKGFITNADSEVEGKLTTNSLVAASLNYPTTDGDTGQVLQTDGSGNLSFVALPSGVTTLSALNDTDTSSLVSGYILQWDGTDWVSQAPSFTLSQISDFNAADYATGAEGDLATTAHGWGNHAAAGYATQTYVDTAVSDLVDAAPGALDTLNELAAAIGDDANFSTTITNQIAGKADASHTHVLADITDFDAADYATGAEGDLASSALQPGDIGVSVQGYNANTVVDANYVATDNNFTDADHTKLDGIEAGAEVNVNADWNAVSGDAQILNKPSLVTAINDLSDVDTNSNAPANGDVLIYDTDKWVPRQANTLTLSAAQNTAQSLSQISVPLASNMAAVQVDYTLNNGTSIRAGILHAVSNGSTYEISDLSTIHAGAEADIPDFEAYNAGGGNLGVRVTDAGGYTIKYTVQNLLR